MASKVPRISLNHLLIPLMALMILVPPACDRTATSSDEPPEIPEHLETALLEQWSLLIDDVSMEPTSATTAESYTVEEMCPLVYDFMLHWPLREGLDSTTLGRFELQSPSDATDEISVRNRATGIYPVHKGVHHPGDERWEGDISPVNGQLDGQGLRADSGWPGAWRIPRNPLGLAAFFPALPADGEVSVDWPLSAGFDDDGDTPPLRLRVANHVTVGDEAAAILEARPTADGDDLDFFGRFVIAESGRLLAAIWTTSANRGRTAVGVARLTGSCEGVALPPLPQARNANPAR